MRSENFIMGFAIFVIVVVLLCVIIKKAYNAVDAIDNDTCNKENIIDIEKGFEPITEEEKQQFCV